MSKHGIDVSGSGRAELVCGVAFCATCAIRCHPQGRPPDLRRHRPESSYPRPALRLSRRSNANCTFSLPVGDAASGVAGNEGAVPGLQQCGDPGPASKSRTGTSRKPRTWARAAAREPRDPPPGFQKLRRDSVLFILPGVWGTCESRLRSGGPRGLAP